MSDIAPWREVPEGKQVNEFTGELEDKAPLSLNPDPADQRILEQNSIEKPLAELNQLFMEGKITLNGEETTDEPTPIEEVEELEAEETNGDVPVQTSGDDGDSEDTPESSPEQV